ncbi:MAG: hypothetical protein QXX41_04830, partial [Nitrososphaerota archaeon]
NDVEFVDYDIYYPPSEERHPVEAEVILRIDGHDFIGRGLGRGIVHSILNAMTSAIGQYLMLFRRQGLLRENT